MLKASICRYASSGCNYPEGECSGACLGDSIVNRLFHSLQLISVEAVDEGSNASQSTASQPLQFGLASR